jgi:pimeloyl-ACP methyl ester carboxylesterase
LKRGRKKRIAPVPLLLIYGTDDGIVPYHHGRELFDQTQEPKQLWTIEHGGHTEALAEESSGYRQRLVNFFVTALDGKSTAATLGRVSDPAGDSARHAHDFH